MSASIAAALDTRPPPVLPPDEAAFAAGAFLEWYSCGQACWTGDDRLLQDTPEVVQELRSQATALVDTDDRAWLGEVLPHVDFALCVGYLLNIAVRTRNPTAKERRSPAEAVHQIDCKR